MKTFTKLFAATALLASASTATLAQVSAGGALDAAGSVSVDAGNTNAGASVTGNANSDAGGSSSNALDAAGSAAGGLDAAGSVDANTPSGGASGSGSANGAANAAANSNAGGNGSTSASGALNAGGSGNANANGNAGGNANANATASADGQVNYGQVISDLRTSSVTAAEIEALGTNIDVTVVTLTELRGNAGENASALDQAVSESGSIVAELQSADTTYTNLRTAIQAELGSDYQMEDIVGITTSADGQVTVVVDDTN